MLSELKKKLNLPVEDLGASFTRLCVYVKWEENLTAMTDFTGISFCTT